MSLPRQHFWLKTCLTFASTPPERRWPRMWPVVDSADIDTPSRDVALPVIVVAGGENCSIGTNAEGMRGTGCDSYDITP